MCKSEINRRLTRRGCCKHFHPSKWIQLAETMKAICYSHLDSDQLKNFRAMLLIRQPVSCHVFFRIHESMSLVQPFLRWLPERRPNIEICFYRDIKKVDTRKCGSGGKSRKRRFYLRKKDLHITWSRQAQCEFIVNKQPTPITHFDRKRASFGSIIRNV